MVAGQMTGEASLQERFAPKNACFGCGPANEKGLRIRSLATGTEAHDDVVCRWRPAGHHEAFPGVLNGGIVGTLLDCHCNWTAIWHLICRDALDRAPCSVTYDYHVTMKRPTPTDGELHLRARVVESDGNRVSVEGELEAGGIVTATCRGRFVAVGEGHPAFRRW